MTSAPRRADDPPQRSPHALWLRPWLPVVAGIACFLNSLPNQFTYDDHALIVSNPRLHDWTNVRAIWLSDWWQGVEAEDDAAQLARDRLYRPLTLFSLALNHAVHGLDPLGYHVVNVALHGLVCWLVWRLARRISRDAAVAAITALVFAVHPVHVEAIAGVVGRAELLSTAFLLVGLLVAVPESGPSSAARVLAAWPLFLLALFAKETAISYPAVVAALWLATLRARWPRPGWWLARGALLVVPALLYLALRYVALEGALVRSELAAVQMNPLVSARGVEHALGVLTVLGHYVRLLVVPSVLSCDYGLAIIDPRRGFELLTAIGLATVIVWTWGCWQATAKSEARRLSGALALALLASYALISNAVLLIGVSLGERLMYWPSVPALLLASMGAHALWTRMTADGAPGRNRGPLLRVLGIAILAGLALRSIDRNWDWHDNLTLFERDARTYPQGAHLNLCLAREIHDLGLTAKDPRDRRRHLERADQLIAAALQIDPGFAAALSVRGQVQLLLGNQQQAERLFESALLLQPGLRDARRLLLAIRGADSGAEQQLAARRAELTTRPSDVDLQLALARSLVQRGRTIDARAILQDAIRLAPERADAALLHAKVAAMLGDERVAIAGFRHVLTIEPEQWEAHTNLALLIGASDKTAALRHAERAVQLQPTDVRVQTNYAEALALNGRTAEALRILRGLLAVLAADDPLRAAVAERIGALERE